MLFLIETAIWNFNWEIYSQIWKNSNILLGDKITNIIKVSSLKKTLSLIEKLAQCLSWFCSNGLPYLTKSDNKIAENYTKHQIFFGFYAKTCMGLTPILINV